MRDSNGTVRRPQREPITRAKEAPSLADLLKVLGHHRRLVAATVAVFLAGGAAYVATAPRLYTATASLLIDTRREDPVQKDRPAADAQVETTALESQSQLLTSDAIATAVVRQLGLTDDPEFTEDDSPLVLRAVRGLIDQAGRLLAPEPERPERPEDLERNVTERLVKALTAGRSGRSYVVTLSAISRDPEKAARIANAVTSAYSEDQLNFRLGAVDRSAVWLKARAAELRQQSLDADRAVQDYKTANNIVDTQRGFVKEQQLVDMNTQLVLARAKVAERMARVEQAQRLVADGIPDAASTESLANPVIVKLRQQYLDDARREGELRSRYGADHPAVAALRANMDEVRRSIRDEAQRVTESFQTDYRNARAGEAELDRNLTRLVAQTAETNRERVQLRALETTAQTYRTLFETFLQQYATTLQQQSFPVAWARVITPAKPPKRKSYPRTALILLGSLCAGLGIGWLGAYAREGLHPVLRDARQVEDATGLNGIGLLPEIGRSRRRAGRSWAGLLRRAGPEPAGRGDPMLRILRRFPESRFALTLRHVRAALDHARAPAHGEVRGPARGSARVVGVLSTEAGDGKTVVAANLAQLYAREGRRTALLDCDVHHPAPARSRHDAGPASPEPLALAGRAHPPAGPADDVTALQVVPAAWAQHDRHGPEALCSSAFVGLVEELRGRFDVVVLDLPCLETATEARAVAGVADGLVVVCAAGRTHVDALARAVDRWDAAGLTQIVGFVMNRVRMRERRPLRAAEREPDPRPRAAGRAGLRAVS